MWSPQAIKTINRWVETAFSYFALNQHKAWVKNMNFLGLFFAQMIESSHLVPPICRGGDDLQTTPDCMDLCVFKAYGCAGLYFYVNLHIRWVDHFMDREKIFARRRADYQKATILSLLFKNRDCPIYVWHSALNNIHNYEDKSTFTKKKSLRSVKCIDKMIHHNVLSSSCRKNVLQ